MKFPKKFTITRIAVHDFNRALRVWKSHLPEVNILQSLVSQRARALAIALRNLGMAVIGSMWLSTAKSDLALKLFLVDLAVPAAYVNFVVAALVCGATIHIFNYMMLNEFVRIAVLRLFKFDAPSAFTALQDGGSVWAIGIITQFRFFQSSEGHNRLGKVVLWLINLPLLALFVAIYSIEITVGIRVLRDSGLFSPSGAFTIVAWLLIAYPLAYLALIQIPFSFKRNVNFIRWIFLTRLYRRQGLWPPQVGSWVANQNSARTKAEIESENEARTKYLRKKYGLG